MITIQDVAAATILLVAILRFILPRIGNNKTDRDSTFLFALKISLIIFLACAATKAGQTNQASWRIDLYIFGIIVGALTLILQHRKLRLKCREDEPKADPKT
ncbi:MAG: hypothetical protein WC205_10600 [Opitutaceae bacterium]|jgi:peptidoglycan/LPS O-acetylase OafA/YrhL